MMISTVGGGDIVRETHELFIKRVRGDDMYTGV
jgi:hypothetical protein